MDIIYIFWYNETRWGVSPGNDRRLRVTRLADLPVPWWFTESILKFKTTFVVLGPFVLISSFLYYWTWTLLGRRSWMVRGWDICGVAVIRAGVIRAGAKWLLTARCFFPCHFHLQPWIPISTHRFDKDTFL